MASAAAAQEVSARLPLAAAEAADAAAILRELVGEVRAMRRDMAMLLARSERPLRPLSDADAKRVAVLLPAIDGAAGDDVWTLQDVSALALIPGNDTLAAALAPLVRGRGGLRAAGKFLARAVGHEVSGYRLAQVGADRAGALWTVRRV